MSPALPYNSLGDPVNSLECADNLDALSTKEYTSQVGCFVIIWTSDDTVSRRGFKAIFNNYPKTGTDLFIGHFYSQSSCTVDQIISKDFATTNTLDRILTFPYPVLGLC